MLKRLTRLTAPLVALVSAAALVTAVASPSALRPADAAATTPALDGSRSPQAVLADTGTEVVVALFSLPGCPYCEVVRRNYLRHLAGTVSGVRVVEYSIGDERVFTDAAHGQAPRTAAALAESMGIRVAPTVVFLGEAGQEIAERLVGYNSPDFYGAYLDQRIAHALARGK